MRILTQEELKDLIVYDPDTGIFQKIIKSKEDSYLVHIGTVTNKGHVVFTLRNKTYSAGRIAWLYMTGENVPDNMTVSYHDLNRSNLKFSNLFLTSNSRNKSGVIRKLRPQKKRSSKLPTCVYKDREGLFYTRIRIDRGRYKSKGFETPEEASALYFITAKEFREKGTFDSSYFIREE